MSAAAKLMNNDLGAIKDYLGILQTDKKSLKPDRLLETGGISATALAKLLGIARSNLYRDSLYLEPTKEITTKIIHFVIVADLAFLLFQKSRKKALEWLSTPNIELFGSTPFETCLRGDGVKLINWLRSRLGQTPASIF